MRGRTVRLLIIPALLSGAAGLGAQSARAAGAANAATTMLAAATARPGISPDARAALTAANQAFYDWRFAQAYDLYGKALEIDSTLGIARILRGQIFSGSPANLQRGFEDLVKTGAGIPLLTYALGMVANGPDAARLLGVAREMFPNDPHVDFDFANSIPGVPRLDSLRALAARHPNFAAAPASLSYTLLLPEWSTPADSLFAAAIDAAAEAIRRDPSAASGHSAMARALTRSGRYAEGAVHAREALKIDPLQQFAHLAMAEAIMHDPAVAKPVDRARASIDSAVLSHPAPTPRMEYRRIGAQLLMHDGRIDQMEKEMMAIAAERAAAGGGVAAQRMAADTYGRLGVLLAAAGHSADAAIASRVQRDPAADPELTTYAFALSKQPAKAREALNLWLTLVPQSNPNRPCITALVLNSEGKYAEALTTAAAGRPGRLSWCDVARFDALMGQGKKPEADAVRAAFLKAPVTPNWSLIVAVMKYRGLAKK